MKSFVALSPSSTKRHSLCPENGSTGYVFCHLRPYVIFLVSVAIGVVHNAC